jgi:hypothetical protein
MLPSFGLHAGGMGLGGGLKVSALAAAAAASTARRPASIDSLRQSTAGAVDSRVALGGAGTSGGAAGAVVGGTTLRGEGAGAARVAGGGARRTGAGITIDAGGAGGAASIHAATNCGGCGSASCGRRCMITTSHSSNACSTATASAKRLRMEPDDARDMKCEPEDCLMNLR